MKIKFDTRGMPEELRIWTASVTSSREKLSILSKDDFWKVRQAVATNLNTLATTLSILAKDKDVNVRTAVASNPSASQEVLSKFADDKHRSVRELVARNPNTSEQTLLNLAKDKAVNVRIAVASNSSTTQEILFRLANDKNRSVRELVAINPNIFPFDQIPKFINQRCFRYEKKYSFRFHRLFRPLLCRIECIFRTAGNFCRKQRTRIF